MVAGCSVPASDGSAAFSGSAAFTSFPLFTVFVVLVLFAFTCFGLGCALSLLAFCQPHRPSSVPCV